MNKPFCSVLQLVLLLSLGGGSFLLGRSLDNSRTTFEQKILPIFEQNCFVCHSGILQRSGLDLRSQESVLKGGDHGPAIIPGKAENSLLYQLITHSLEPHMPMGGAKLAKSEIAQIAEWINALPPELKLPSGTSLVRLPGYKVTEQDRQFWSFQKPIRSHAPPVKNRSWIRNVIDSFVLSRLEEKNLRPSPPAEPPVLLRRVYFDLIGLPPSPQEIDAFLADRSTNAFEKVIDRLLDSPRYGERWGRHWLDLARYADSGGFEFDYDRPHAWRYRDYVIRSFNEDKPYDQFIKEQLAADELSPAPESLIATGFCRNGPTVDNASNDQTRMDELDDMVSTTSSVFLGLTVGCARCHDHKYDPIPQKDYYRMQAVFFPSRKTDLLLVDRATEEAFKAANKEVDEKVKPHREKIAVIEKPHREKLLADKVDLFVRIAMQAGALEGKDPEAYRAVLAQQFARDVKLQPEEIEALLSPEELRARKEIQNEIEKLNRLRPKPLPRAMGITNKESETAKSFVLKRGDFRQKGEEVQPGFPSVLVNEGVLQEKTDGDKTGSRRTRLAEWIASPENPLTARVAVNRLWQYHFGKGIVRTSSDFGVNGDRPSHPELLDWLATELIARGWSFKAIHRLILSSNSYRQSNRFDAQAAAIDPDNRLVWRMNPRRLEAEIIRDSVLAISGNLNPQMEGPGIYPRIDPSVISTGSTNKWPVDVKEGPPEWRRSVYIFIKRSVLLPLIEVFDCPDTTVSTPARSSSINAPQALALLNNGFILEQSEYFARRVLQDAGPEPAAQIRYAYKLALGRGATGKELNWSLEFLSRQAKSHAAAETGSTVPPKLAALRDFCHALFNLNEFLYLD